MDLHQIDVTGCRIIGAITKELGHLGPKHHGIILGRATNGDVYIAEIMSYGYQISTYDNFSNRYFNNGEIMILPNDGDLENVAVAKRAIDEIKRGGKGIYNLITNNCECFVNRAMYGKSVSNQVINTAVGVTFAAGLAYVLKKSYDKNKG
ncbi:lecithin retinol acyltransferase family protein [Sessilibacter corallicola]|uniref:LRAT domain-containing protein n=1 Tax=Sessilibacter corallicola TaxID=2904075 RepID=A0ABQ0A9H6_9GAMM